MMYLSCVFFVPEVYNILSTGFSSKPYLRVIINIQVDC